MLVLLGILFTIEKDIFQLQIGTYILFFQMFLDKKSLW